MPDSGVHMSTIVFSKICETRQVTLSQLDGQCKPLSFKEEIDANDTGAQIKHKRD